jgi:hypothetical protein
MKRALLISALVIMAAAISAFVAMWSLARYQQTQIESLSARVSALRAGESTLSDAERLRSLYKSQAMTEDGPCNAASCRLRIALYNFLVNRPEKPSDVWWINQPIVRRLGIRPAEAVATIVIGNERVREVHFRTQYQTPSGYWLSAEWDAVDQFRQGLKCESEVLGRHPHYSVGSGSMGQGDVPGNFVSATFQSEATDSEQRRCRRIRFACMTSLFECGKYGVSGAGPLMPMIYQDLLDDETGRNADPEKYSMALRECDFGKRSPN